MQTKPTNIRALLSQFLEMQIPMVLGALVCFLVGRMVPAPSPLAAIYHPGTYLFTIGDLLFLAVPAVAWKILRGHGWPESLEMAGAMIMPVAVVIVIGLLASHDYLLFLVTAMYPLMCLGMVAYMLARRDRFAGRVVRPVSVLPQA